MLNYEIKTSDIPREHIPWNSERGPNNFQWDFTKVEIFYEGDKIGQYVRNFPHVFETFCPFHQNGQDYALISKDYRRTALIELPSCKFLCSVRGNINPVSYHVPAVNEDVIGQDMGNGELVHGPNAMWALVAGSSENDDEEGYRVQFIDLSKAFFGDMRQDARFGNLQLNGMCRQLKEARVPCYTRNDWNGGKVFVDIPRMKTFYIPNGPTSPKSNRKFNERLALEAEFDLYY